MNATPVIAIVGRTNVGKSTLFNRLIGRKKAITSPIPGTTTDINFGHCHWRGTALTVIDTAGLDLTSKNATEPDLKRQAELAMAKADIILLLTDAKTGLMPQDRALVSHLRRTKKKILLAANKADNPASRRNTDAPEWLKLGLGRPAPVSAANGSGVGDLLDAIIAIVESEGLDSKPVPEIDLRVAIVGKPNVGKSSLLNTLAGEERVIVSEVPHTTKEPQDTLLTYEHPAAGTKHILLVDTVGIRKKARVGPGLEKIGVHMSLAELERADVVFLMIDAASGIGLQEKKLAGLLEEKCPAVVVVINKWDLAQEKGLGTADEYARYVAGQMPFFSWAPVAFISAKTGSRVGKLLGYALAAAANRERTVPQEELDAFTEKLKKVHHSAFKRGEKRPKVYGITQTGAEPPSFMVIVQDKETIHPNFLRFVENRLRESFDLEGTPIRVRAREID
jgi:GTP-binding protein